MGYRALSLLFWQEALHPEAVVLVNLVSSLSGEACCWAAVHLVKAVRVISFWYCTACLRLKGAIVLLMVDMVDTLSNSGICCSSIL